MSVSSNYADLKRYLTYPQHESVLIESLDTHHERGEYLDLTFICKNNVRVKVHKTVMLAVSEFLTEILLSNSDDVVYISVPDIDSNVMNNLIDLLYKGETKVNIEELLSLKELTSFLCICLRNADIKTADSLKQVISGINIYSNKFVLDAEESDIQHTTENKNKKHFEQSQNQGSLSAEKENSSKNHGLLIPNIISEKDKELFQKIFCIDSQSQGENNETLQKRIADVEISQNNSEITLRSTEENISETPDTQDTCGDKDDLTMAIDDIPLHSYPSVASAFINYLNYDSPATCTVTTTTGEVFPNENSASQNVASTSTQDSSIITIDSDEEKDLTVLDLAPSSSVPSLHTGAVVSASKKHERPSLKKSRIQENMLYCDNCGKMFVCPEYFKTHNCRKVIQYECKECKSGFQSVHLFRDHMKTHEKPFSCRVCKEKFYKIGQLNAHMKLHAQGKKYKCQVCGIQFKELPHYQKHLILHHGEKQYKCNICGLTFHQLKTLNAHKKIHTDERPFKCQICGAQFNQSSHLQQHSIVHGTEKPYKCDVCGVSFNQLSNFNMHMKFHAEQNPFKCQICGIQFSELSYLQQHSIIHNSDKPYKCEVCGLAFQQLQSLNIHMRIHTSEEMPFKCQICGIQFSDSLLLQQHSIVHSCEKPYKCNICGLAFQQLATLNTHLTIHNYDITYL